MDLLAKAMVTEKLGADDQAIVDAFLRRQQQSPAPPDETHVKAPPDLLDDDAAKPEGETQADTPEPEKPAKKAPEPVLDENGKPLPVSDRRYINAMRERYVAQQKKNQGGS